MPKAEVTLEVPQVEAMIRDQYPPLAGTPVVPVGEGWDNFMFRVGDDHVARFPRRQMSAPMVEHEARWLPQLSDNVNLPIPVPIFLGEADRGFPWRWSIAPWIEGTQLARAKTPIDATFCADQLGRFLRGLHSIAPDEAPVNPWRGMHVAERDDVTRERIASVADESSERAGLLAVWQGVISAAEHSGPATWLHGDFHPANVLTLDGRISGVIDFTDLTSGDPATDLSIAWMVPGIDADDLFGAYGNADESLRCRSRGWALALGVTYIDHGADNETMTAVGRHTLRALLAEADQG